MEHKRELNYDIMRIFSIFFMVLLHVAEENQRSVPIDSFNWSVFNIYNGSARFCVPVMTMLSGAFMLSPQKNIALKSVWTKYIPRIVLSYVVWSALYSIVGHFAFKARPTQTFLYFINGASHLWFLYMIAGLYLITPILRIIAANRKMTAYFLAISFVFSFAFPTVGFLSERYFSYMSPILSNINLQFVMGYTSYFLLGYFLKTSEIKGKLAIAIYIAGILGLLFTILYSQYRTLLLQKHYTIYGNMSVNVFFVSMAIFVFFKNVVSRARFMSGSGRFIRLLSDCSFGVYLIHILVLWLVNKTSFTVLAFNPVASVPILTAVIFAASFAAIWLIRRIPICERFT